MGLGVTAGALMAARGESPEFGRRLYLAGIAIVAAGMAACALAPVLAVAVVAFGVIGVGNGIALTSENVLLQQLIPDAIKGRVFGLKAAMISGAFLVSYVCGGLLVAAVGTRATFARDRGRLARRLPDRARRARHRSAHGARHRSCLTSCQFGMASCQVGQRSARSRPCPSPTRTPSPATGKGRLGRSPVSPICTG